MMGQMVSTGTEHYGQRGLGFTPIIAAAPAAGPAAPIVAAVAAIATAAALLIKFFKGRGYDPNKLQDTAITEAFRIGANGLWNDLTGDNLPVNCTPGQCGAQNVAIFTASRFPDVPYPAGRSGTDIEQYVAALQAAIADARSKLVRPESVAGFDQNANYFLTLLAQVRQLRAQQGPVSSITQGLEDLVAGKGSIVSLLPWAIGAYAVYRWVL